MAIPKQTSSHKKESAPTKESGYKKEIKQPVIKNIKTPSWLKFKSKSKSLGYLP